MQSHPIAEIIAVGSELLTASRIETNSLFLTDRLNGLGIVVERKVVVGDRESALSESFQTALRRAQVVILTGGLGPTSDDVTREIVAGTLGLRLRTDSRIIARLEELYRRFGHRMAENNRRQAEVPEGAEVLPNNKGTAPGLFLRHEGRLVFLLPGPPRELNPMVDAEVLPRLRRYLKTTRQFVRQLRVASLAESAVDQRIAPLYRVYPDIEPTVLSSLGIIDLFFYWRGPDDEELAQDHLEKLVGEVRTELGEAVFSDRHEELEAVVGRELSGRGLRLATAESCTGGLLGKLVTDVDGSSGYYLGGVVAYSNPLKRKLLGVKQETLQAYGAVSRETAAEMAAGVCRLTGAEAGLAVTGIAGPSGGSDDKPVGTVFFGLSLRGEARAMHRRLPGDRDSVRTRSARFALDWLRRELV